MMNNSHLAVDLSAPYHQQWQGQYYYLVELTYNDLSKVFSPYVSYPIEYVTQNASLAATTITPFELPSHIHNDQRSVADSRACMVQPTQLVLRI